MLHPVFSVSCLKQYLSCISARITISATIYLSATHIPPAVIQIQWSGRTARHLIAQFILFVIIELIANYQLTFQFHSAFYSIHFCFLCKGTIRSVPFSIVRCFVIRYDIDYNSVDQIQTTIQQTTTIEALSTKYLQSFRSPKEPKPERCTTQHG